MRFLVDECTGPVVAAWLRSEGYEVFSIFEQARGSNDDFIIRKAYQENWILITNDKDFGEKVFRDHNSHHGVIFMRLSDDRARKKVEVLQHLLKNYSDRLPDQFVVVTEKQVRFSR